MHTTEYFPHPRVGRRAVCLILALGVVLWAGAPGAHAARLAARSATASNPAITLSNGYLSQLACGSAQQCTAVEPNGTTLTFNPTAAGKVTHARPLQADGSVAITCPSAASCVEADAAGHVAVFAPRRAAQKPATFTMTGASYQTSVACPSTSECVALSWTVASAFDPRHLGSPQTTTITANGNDVQPTIVCPSTSLCVGSNGAGNGLYSFAPHDAATAKVHLLSSTPQIGSLDCTSRTFCVALASPKANPGVNTGYITFNPTNPGNPGVKRLTLSSLEFMACASDTLCAAAGNNGGVITFNPKRPGHTHLTALPTGNDVAGLAFAGKMLVLISYNATKAVLDPSAPPKSVPLTALNKATPIQRG